MSGGFGHLMGEGQGPGQPERELRARYCTSCILHSGATDSEPNTALRPGGSRSPEPSVPFQLERELLARTESDTSYPPAGTRPSRSLFGGQLDPVSHRNSPPLGAFGNQLLENFKGLFSKHNLKPLLIGSGATALATLADDEVKEYFGESRRLEALGEIGAVVGSPLVLGGFSGAMLIWGYNTENDRLRSFGFSLTQGFIVNGAVTLGLKAAIPRTRPNGEDELSFPSGHTSSVFTVAVIVDHYYGKFAIPAYVTAGLVGLSRLEKNKHHLSDVIAGATLGFIVGQTVCRQTDKFRVGPITWMPLVLPEGGFAVGLSWNPRN